MKRQSCFTAMLLVATVWLLSGCAGSSSHMKEVAGDAISIAPSGQEAAVVFMRPSGLGFAINSSVFDIDGDTNTFVGIVSAKKKIVYKTKPGQHMFMVIGESADFMQADLQAGKTYYALVTPRMGAWKARFSLKPVGRNELSSAEFKEWVDGCAYTENTASSFGWAKDNGPSVQAKKREYLPKWHGKSGEDKPYLRAEDCL